MEALISSIITGIVVMALIGVVYNSLIKRVDKMENSKVNAEKCDVVHREADKKFDALFRKLDEQHDLMVEIGANVKAIVKKNT